MASHTHLLRADGAGNTLPPVAHLGHGNTASLLEQSSASGHRPAFTSLESISNNVSAPESVHEELEGLMPETSHDELTRTSPGDRRQGMPACESPHRDTNGVRKKHVTLKLEKLESSGQYTLRVDDAELRALLKGGFERSKDGELKRKRSRFSDLVFTQQFTAFDRQNPASSTSIFHGFFSLFW